MFGRMNISPWFKKKNPGDSNMMSDSQAVAMAEPVQGIEMQPTNLVAMPDPLEAPIQVPQGLQTKWHVGERIPWKGIWFVVTKVDAGRLELIPERMTFKMAKKVEAIKAARA